MSSVSINNPRPGFLLAGLVCVMMVSMPVEMPAQESSTPTTTTVEPDADRNPTAPVVVDGIPLFSIRGVSAFPAEKRAQQISKQIVAAAANRAVSKDSLWLAETPDATIIKAGNQTIMAVVDADALLEGVDRSVLAHVFRSRIGEGIDAYRYDREPARLTRHGLYALSAALALLCGIFLGRRVVRRAHETFERRYRNRIRGVAIQSFQIIRTDQLWRILTGTESLLLAAALLATGYLCFHFILSLFPWTRGLADNLFALLIKPTQTMVGNLALIIPDLVFLVILVLITRYVLALIRLFFTHIETSRITLGDFDPEWAKPTYRLVRVAAIACALVVAYPYIPGSSSQAFKGVTLFIGVLFSLGSTSLVGNIIAGYTLTYRRTFKPGDRVKIGDHIGDVEQSRVMATYIRTPKNEMLVVPNSKIINEEVVNYSAMARQEGLILHTTVGIGYGVPWRQVEAMLLEAASRSPGLLREPRPYVLQKKLGDFAVTYELNGYCDQPQIMGRVYTQMHRNILDVFNEYGVQIMVPAYESDPKTIKIVPRDQWHSAPAPPSDSADASSIPKAS